MKTKLSHILAGLVVAPAIFTTEAANWPGWRGADGTGVSPEKNLPLKWSATENVKWRIDLPERGNSSPIVWGDRVFIAQAVGDRRTLLCLDRATGKTLWQSGVTYAEREQTQRDNPYCTATPVTDGERIIAAFGSAGLYCYDFSGKELWKRDLGKMSHQFGNGSSPVLASELCVFNFGPDEKARIVAVNKRTGAIAWETPAPGAETAVPPPPPTTPRTPEPLPPPVPAPGEMLAPSMLSQGDKNADAKLSRDEFAGLAQAWFDKIDSDKAGKLDSRTFGERFAGLIPMPQGFAPSAGGERRSGFNPVRGLGFGFFVRSDADRDGTLTREEFSAAFSKWFADWDTANDGTLDDAKLRAGLDAALPRPQPPRADTGVNPGGFDGGGRGGGRGSAGSWSTPLLIQSGGRDELIVNFPTKISALDPKTGKELWSARGLGGASYTTPVFGEGALVATSSGPGGGAAVALKPGGAESWKLDRFQSAIGSGVIANGHLYTISQNGVAACSDLKSGATIWEERLRGSGSRGSSWSSILLADGKLFVPNQGGDVSVLRAATKFELLATNSINESTNASLAASDGALFLRTDKSLWCFTNSAAK